MSTIRTLSDNVEVVITVPTCPALKPVAIAATLPGSQRGPEDRVHHLSSRGFLHLTLSHWSDASALALLSHSDRDHRRAAPASLSCRATWPAAAREHDDFTINNRHEYFMAKEGKTTNILQPQPRHFGRDCDLLLGNSFHPVLFFWAPTPQPNRSQKAIMMPGSPN